VTKLAILSGALAASLAIPAAASEYGQATWYSNPYHHGMIAAHKSLPFGARVRVYNLDNGRQAVVTIVDRGPYARGRIIDLSNYAADVLGFRRLGVAHVRLDRI